MVEKILIVDDDSQVRDMLSRALERKGYEVIQASDGAEGAKVCLEQKPDLAVVDILMPQKDGIEVIREIGAKAPEVSLIAISGGGDRVSVDFLPAAEKLGAKKILYKPVATEDFVQAVQEVLASR